MSHKSDSIEPVQQSDSFGLTSYDKLSEETKKEHHDLFCNFLEISPTEHTFLFTCNYTKEELFLGPIFSYEFLMSAIERIELLNINNEQFVKVSVDSNFVLIDIELDNDTYKQFVFADLSNFESKLDMVYFSILSFVYKHNEGVKKLNNKK